MLNEREVNKIKEQYPIGTRIELISMDDPYPVPSGTCGTICDIDDQGQLDVKWDNGRTLSLIPNVDKFKVIDIEKNISI